MFNFNKFVQQAMLAAAMVFGSGAAFAGPSYQVTIDTSAFAGQTGLLDLAFSNGFIGTVGATATLSNFSGDFGAEYERFGTVAGAIPGAVSMTNAELISFLTQNVNLGGMFGFSVNFSGAFEIVDDVNESLLSVSLYNADMTGLLAQLANFTIVPGNGSAAAYIVVDAGSSVVVSEVPEPSELLLVLTALAIAGVASRRRAV